MSDEEKVIDLPASAAKEVEREEQPSQPETEETQQPTVHILVQRTAEETSVEVVGTGDIRATEIETVLRMGLKKWQSQLGMS